MRASELCTKITEVFPEIGTCGIDVNVAYDEDNKAWAVDLERNGRHLRTYVEIDEADHCVEGRECVSLGLQIGQLKDNIAALSQ